ncbi:unnamed protein product [Parajaminaea phylloscopi]
MPSQAEMPRQGPSHPASVLSAHIHHTALLSSSCHDVTILAFARLYRLHRVFLVQSAFFSSLLLGGFSEGAKYVTPSALPKRGRGQAAAHVLEDEENVLELTFDDPNITRPAFEYCISLLYGANPQLVLPTWALPTTANPLCQSSAADTGEISQTRQTVSVQDLPVGSKMPATPRFLVSLLATSIYLGIPSLTNSTLTLILASFTPFTVSTYLRFALGNPIIGAVAARERGSDDNAWASSRPWWDWELEGPCWGFDCIGRPQPVAARRQREYDTDGASSAVQAVSNMTQTMSMDTSSDGEDELVRSTSTRSNTGADHRRSVSPVVRSKQRQEDPQPGWLPESQDFSYSRLSASGRPQMESAEHLFDYGSVSSRIGESCLCYLSRWGSELAAQESLVWETEKERLSNWIDEACMPSATDSRLLVCTAVAAYLLPRGAVPAELDASATALFGVDQEEGAKSRVPDTVWDLPAPPLNVFIHPALSHQTVSKEFLSSITGSSPADPLSDDEDGGLDTLGDACSHGVVDFDLLDTGPASSLGMTSARFVDLLSCDAFFVHSELERFQLAKDLVQMRRSQRLFAQHLAGGLATLEAMRLANNSRPTPDAVGSDGLSAVRIKREHTGEDMSYAGSDRFYGAEEPSRYSTSQRGAEGSGNESMGHSSFIAVDDDEVEELDQDDQHYLRLFKEGIYYSHLSFSDLKRISYEAELLAQEEEDSLADDEINETSSFAPSPDTSISSLDSPVQRQSQRRKAARQAPIAGGARIFAPIDTLQAALWAGNELKNQILSSAGRGQDSIFSASSTSPHTMNPDGIRRGLAFAAEGSPLINEGRAELMPATTPMAASSSQTSLTNSPTVDESALGVTSSLKQFAAAVQQAGNARSRRSGTRTSRALRAGQSPTQLLSPNKNDPGQLTSLGGLAYSSLSGSGSIGASKSLLSKRYFSVPVDDTVRFGEFFAGLLNGSNWSSGNTPIPPPGTIASSVVNIPSQHAHEASGLAMRRDPYTLPPAPLVNDKAIKSQRRALIELDGSQSLVLQLEEILSGGPFADSKRTRTNLFGLRNKGCKGKSLGKVGEEVAKRRALIESGKTTVETNSDSVRRGQEQNPPFGSPDGIFVSVPNTTSAAQAAEGARTGESEEERQHDNHDSRGARGGGGSPSEEEGELDGGLVLAKLERRCWTGYEPMRVGVDYYGLQLLEEKQRLYSPSFFYAGSVWNLYVQTVRKQKGTQLGVYLHRQSPFEPLPPASAHPDTVAYLHNGSAEGDGGVTPIGRNVEPGALTDRNGRIIPRSVRASAASFPSSSSASTSFLHTSPAGPGVSGTPGTAHGSRASVSRVGASPASTTAHLTPTGGGQRQAVVSGPPVLPGVSPAIPYRDPRKVVRAYFSIHCYAPSGSSLTRFDSGPDKFSESQSWGWKSSSLMGLWELEGGALEGGRSESGDGFRCVLTLGVI